MSLKPLRIATNEAPAKAKSDIRVIEIDGTKVSEYNAAVIALKNAKATVETEGASLKALGLEKLYEIAVGNPDTPPSSIKLRDESGETVRLTSQNKYAQFDPEVAEQVFKELGAEISEHAQYVATASFDAKIFLAQKDTVAGDEGKFSVKIYNAYKQAIDRATAQLIRDGLLPAETKSPLATSQVATVMPTFHDSRWKSFPSVEAQQRLTEVITNTVMLVPVVDATGEEAPKGRKRS